MKKLFLLIILPFIAQIPCAADVSKPLSLYKEDVSYVDTSDQYRKERCKLDVYIPKDKKNFPIFVWFHGGGISAGEKSLFPKSFPTDGIAVVAINYRLSPKITANLAIEDTAEAIAWVVKNAESLGANPKQIFVGGHSAGAYLSAMATFDPAYLQKFGISAKNLAGLILISGQMTTHFQVKKDLKYEQSQYLPVIDKYAPLNFVETKLPPILIIMGESSLEFPARVEENKLLVATLKKLQSTALIEMFELQGYGHACEYPAPPLMKKFIDKINKMNERK